jgi:arylsulfatase A-like enzyme
VPNIEQEVWMAKAATRIVLPHLKESAKPFILLFWSRDPDKSQHDGKDSIGETDPGINGPSGKAGTRDADTMLGELLDSLKKLGLDKTTDVFVTADHGFTTTVHASTTSPSTRFGAGTASSDLPNGFLATDLAATLALPARTTGSTGPAVDFSNGAKLSGPSAALGPDPAHPVAVVMTEGGSDVIYLPGADAKGLAGRIVDFLFTQDYVSAIFVNDNLGKFPGTLPMSALNLMGAAKTPVPAIYVSLRTFAGTCADKLLCTIGVGDASRPTGQGDHGSLSRAETRNFMAALGPDFKAGYADPAPISNAEIAPTLAHIMGLDLAPKGKLTGRVISEALAGGAPVNATRQVIASEPGPGGMRTILDQQSVGDTRYFDAAGFEGRTVGLLPIK